MARALGLDEDLAEALALAHDLGHTPFGHAGEDALDDCMRELSAASTTTPRPCAIVTRLEQRYADFDGLNLTWETLEGLVKHNGPLLDAPASRSPATRRAACRARSSNTALGRTWSSRRMPAPRRRSRRMADDIAYNAHDIDDGLRAGLFDLDDLRTRAVRRRGCSTRSTRAWPGLERPRLIHELVRRVITRFVEDVIAESRAAARGAGARRCGRGARRGRAGRRLLATAWRAAEREIKAFLFANMYRHPRVMNRCARRPTRWSATCSRASR